MFMTALNLSFEKLPISSCCWLQQSYLCMSAGVQVWRHQSGTGHSFVYWPRKMSSPVQCFNPRQAASAIMKQEGWKEVRHCLRIGTAL